MSAQDLLFAYGVLTSERQELDKKIMSTFKDAVKTFMEKYNVNTIHFDKGNECPCFEHNQIDDNNADCAVHSLTFNENGDITHVSGDLYYEGETLYNEPAENFFNIDYFDLIGYIIYQIDNGLYTEEE